MKEEDGVPLEVLILDPRSYCGLSHNCYLLAYLLSYLLRVSHYVSLTTSRVSRVSHYVLLAAYPVSLTTCKQLD